MQLVRDWICEIDINTKIFFFYKINKVKRRFQLPVESHLYNSPEYTGCGAALPEWDVGVLFRSHSFKISVMATRAIFSTVILNKSPILRPTDAALNQYCAMVSFVGFLDLFNVKCCFVCVGKIINVYTFKVFVYWTFWFEVWFPKVRFVWLGCL